MKDKYPIIKLEDLAEGEFNIYVRLEKTFQNKLFSKENTNLSIPNLAQILQIRTNRLYQWKISNIAFPLFIGYKLVNGYSKRFNWKDFCNSVVEIKFGERSKPLSINKGIFPIKKDPYYWNILFALFFDGSSDCWSSQKNKKIVSPSYTSYETAIMNNLIEIVKTKFGNWEFKINYGSVRLPIIIDKIFKINHKINSFNTKSNKIEKFRLTKEFKNEIKNLDNINKVAILIRFLVDEGDKSLRSLTARNFNLTLSSKSKDLIKIGEIILSNLNIEYKFIKRVRNNSFLLQIKRGKNRQNIKQLLNYAEGISKKYSLCKLSNTQIRCLKKAVKYIYKKPVSNFSHSKLTEYLIVSYLKNHEITKLDKLTEMLKRNDLDFNICSILAILKRLPIKYYRKTIVVNKDKLTNYIPYSSQQLKDIKNYCIAKKLYSEGNTIATIAKNLDKPWSTIKCWVYGRAEPSILKGPWINTLMQQKFLSHDEINLIKGSLSN